MSFPDPPENGYPAAAAAITIVVLLLYACTAAVFLFT
jgi:hypothetical protein